MTRTFALAPLLLVGCTAVGEPMSTWQQEEADMHVSTDSAVQIVVLDAGQRDCAVPSLALGEALLGAPNRADLVEAARGTRVLACGDARLAVRWDLAGRSGVPTAVRVASDRPLDDEELSCITTAACAIRVRPFDRERYVLVSTF